MIQNLRQKTNANVAIMDMRKYLIPNSSAKDSTTQNDLSKNEEKSENKEKLKTEIKSENKETLKNEEKSDTEEKYQPSANFSFPYHKIYGKNRCAQHVRFQKCSWLTYSVQKDAVFCYVFKTADHKNLLKTQYKEQQRVQGLASF